ncbi:hypothetical protein JL721_7755 [Aureococcus anophagefferens]|nr:hypothetical protein JL721_7755 [Aureococcus anophagefferens]
MSGTQDWLLSRCEAEARSSSGHLVELLTVQSVVAECVEDVVEAFRCNELARRREVEVVRLEAESRASAALRERRRRWRRGDGVRRARVPAASSTTSPSAASSPASPRASG